MVGWFDFRVAEVCVTAASRVNGPNARPWAEPFSAWKIFGSTFAHLSWSQMTLDDRARPNDAVLASVDLEGNGS